MVEVVPERFELLDVGSGFDAAFGKVYVERTEHRMGFRVAECHTNPFGVCHGGAMATFADTQLMAYFVVLGEGREIIPTINLSIDYLAPVPLGAWVEASVTLVKRTRTMLFTQAIMTVDGEPVARSSAIYRIRENRSSK